MLMKNEPKLKTKLRNQKILIRMTEVDSLNSFGAGGAVPVVFFNIQFLVSLPFSLRIPFRSSYKFIARLYAILTFMVFSTGPCAIDCPQQRTETLLVLDFGSSPFLMVCVG